MYRCNAWRLSAKSLVKISVRDSDVVSITLLSVRCTLRLSGAARQLPQLDWGFLCSQVSYASQNGLFLATLCGVNRADAPIYEVPDCQTSLHIATGYSTSRRCGSRSEPDGPSCGPSISSS